MKSKIVPFGLLKGLLIGCNVSFKIRKVQREIRVGEGFENTLRIFELDFMFKKRPNFILRMPKWDFQHNGMVN
jgi:hypothetical protein